MNTILHVEGMSCNHCVNAVKGAVTALPGVGQVNVDLEAKTVTVDYDGEQVDVARIIAEIEDQGYDVVV